MALFWASWLIKANGQITNSCNGGQTVRLGWTVNIDNQPTSKPARHAMWRTNRHCRCWNPQLLLITIPLQRLPDMQSDDRQRLPNMQSDDPTIIIDAQALVCNDLFQPNAPDTELFPESQALLNEHTETHRRELADQLRQMLVPPWQPAPSTDLPAESSDATRDTVPPCGHEDCTFPTYGKLHHAFTSMDRSTRLYTVRYMLLAIAATRDQINNLFSCSQAQWQAQRGKRKRSDEVTFEEARSTFMYACIEQRWCRVPFADLVSLNEKIVERHTLTVANRGGYELYIFNHTSAH